MGEEAQRAVRLHVSGRVQGVGYRWNAQRRARDLGLRGWIRNEADGSVVAVAVGPPDAVEAFRVWCEDGPRGARVERVRAEPAEASEVREQDFEIRG